MSRPGYVYVLSNPSMPGIVKIGRSINGGKSRASSLYQTGVPTPFKLEFETFVDNPESVEIRVHEHLEHQGKRVNSSREFFSVSIREVRELIFQIAFCEDDRYIVGTDDFFATFYLWNVAPAFKVSAKELACAVQHLSEDTILEALGRAEDARIHNPPLTKEGESND